MVTVADGKGGTTTQTVSVTVTAVNDAPVAAAIAPVTTAEDTPATITVVASDVDGDALTYSATAQNGTVAAGANGVLTYTPNANFNGTDSVVVTVADGKGGTTTQTVSVTVTPVNDAPVVDAQNSANSVAVAEDGVVFNTVAPAASDVDSTALTFSKAPTQAPLAGLTFNSDGSYSFDASNAAYQQLAAGESKALSFDYVVSDGSKTASSTLTITVTGTNDVPAFTASSLAVTGAEDDASIVGTVAATDVDVNDVLSYSAGSTVPSKGAVTVDSDGSYSYVPNADANGSDSFSVIVNDGNGGVVEQLVAVTITPVNDAADVTTNPGVITGSVTEDGVTNQVAGNADNTDIDNTDDAWAVINNLTSAKGYGSYSVTADGGWTYVLNNGNTDVNNLSAGETLIDNFVIKTEDGTPQTVTITINGTNDTFTYGELQDNFTGSAGSDTFTGGSVVAGGQHSIGTGDTADGKGGLDTLNITLLENSINPNIKGIETVSIQALDDAATLPVNDKPNAVDFLNATDVLTLANNRSNSVLNVNNIQEPLDIKINQASAATNLEFDPTAANAAATNQNIQFMSTGSTVNLDYAPGQTPAKLTAVFNNSANAQIGYNGSDGNALTTVDLTVLNNGTFAIDVDGAGGGDTLIGINGSNALSTLSLSGSDNVTSVRANSAAGFNDLTSVNATGLTGSLTMDQLSAATGMTFMGGNGKTTLTVSSAAVNNNVTFGTNNNDRLVQSSTNLTVNDTATDTGGSNDIWEVHHNGAGTISYTAGGFANVFPSVSGFENIVIDVWNNSLESIVLDSSLLPVGAANVILQDTFLDTNGPNDAGKVDADILGAVTINNASEAFSYIFAANDFATVNVNAATAATSLDLKFTGSASAISGAQQGITTDISVQSLVLGGKSVPANVTVGGSTATFVNVQTAANGMVNLLGTASNHIEVLNFDGVGAILDASGLTTRTEIAPGLNQFVSGDASQTIKGTGAADIITGHDAQNTTEFLFGNGGNDTINGGAGDDIIDGGAGDDIISVGSGLSDLKGGEGDDLFIFNDPVDFNNADKIDGGAGQDAILISGSLFNKDDGVFNKVTSVNEVRYGNSSQLTFNTIANAAGIDTVTKVGGGFADVSIGDGFVGALTVNVGNAAQDSIAATGNAAAAFFNVQGNNTTHNAALNVFVNSETAGSLFLVQGGTTAGDVLNITGNGAGAVQQVLSGISSITEMETINFLDGAGVNTLNIKLVDSLFDNALNNAPGAQDDLILDGTGLGNDSLILDASSLTGNHNIEITTAAGADKITGTGAADIIFSGAGNDTVLGGAGNDTIDGGSGDDTITGGAGADTLTGGTGADTFVYTNVTDSSGTVSIDTIMDFLSGSVPGADRIDISALLNVAGGDVLAFGGNAKDFATAQNSIQAGGAIEFVFETDNNTLWVDVDNNGILNGSDLNITMLNLANNEMHATDVFAV
ncbi:MAG: tandem-95 repeat protein [Zhongshania sp.]|uniref:beta strand repeat-containing protein n=1 Tax=Zhongshania sp. TaxID=1971902 RepID=UPI00263448A4|nr:tandem-95 repeat protein [Zhongshania sp.]MDF1692283.1 tandem-95 repeat protein [Zhongshania sp.]